MTTSGFCRYVTIPACLASTAVPHSQSLNHLFPHSKFSLSFNKLPIENSLDIQEFCCQSSGKSTEILLRIVMTPFPYQESNHYQQFFCLFVYLLIVRVLLFFRYMKSWRSAGTKTLVCALLSRSWPCASTCLGTVKRFKFTQSALLLFTRDALNVIALLVAKGQSPK